PTVEEFRDCPTSRRHGYLAAVVVYHLRDHLAEATAVLTGVSRTDQHAIRTAAEQVDAAVRDRTPFGGFDVVRGVCNGTKHATTRQPHAVPFTAGTDKVRPPGTAGSLEVAPGLLVDPGGGREVIIGDARLDLYQAIRRTLSAFLALYPDLLSECSFTP
ncbi:hypothetical protein, partial [Lichenibacterium ramalinae]|uniref:hypothetical protein n=1 Tax=Lichenibacterium ramalinae TaxID=2316527 RepID=UPI001A93880C